MLLPQAFSRISKIYAYFEVANKRLILNTTNAKQTGIFISMLQKTIVDIAIASLPLKNLSTLMTNWLQRDSCPKHFYIEDTCVLIDPTVASKVIRIKGQDLVSKSILLLLEEGYKVDQLAINWQEKITFVLKENLNMCTIRYTDAVVAETREHTADTFEEEFIANFIIMTEIISLLLNDLLKICGKKNND